MNQAGSVGVQAPGAEQRRGTDEKIAEHVAVQHGHAGICMPAVLDEGETAGDQQHRTGQPGQQPLLADGGGGISSRSDYEAYSGRIRSSSTALTLVADRQSLVLEVRRGDRTITIEYLPRGGEVDGYRWVRRPGVPEARCAEFGSAARS